MIKVKAISPLVGGIFGIISMIIALSTYIIVIILTPNFNFATQMISEFGVGPAGIYFNLGLFISGLIAIPFYIGLGKALEDENTTKSLRNRTVGTAIFSCITFSFIGVFPAIQEDPLALWTHGFFAFLSLSSAVVYCIFFSVLMIKHRWFTNIHAYIGFIAAGIYTLFLLTWWPLTEWLMVYALTPWIFINAMSLIIGNKKGVFS